MNCLEKDKLYNNETDDEKEIRGADINNCFKASDVFLHGLVSEVKRDDVYHIVDTQKHMLSRFEKTNEMLLNFNVLSSTRYTSTDLDFRSHIHLLLDTKKDLDAVFKRIRLLKTKLSVIYPAAFKACTHIYEVPDDEEENEDYNGDKLGDKSGDKLDDKDAVNIGDMRSETDDTVMSSACHTVVSRDELISSHRDCKSAASDSEASAHQVIVPQTVQCNYKPVVATAASKTDQTSHQ